jgi:hypothetical protein
MMRVKIVKLDKWGYNGREYHPEPSDVGLVVRCVAMECWWGDDCVSIDEKIPLVNKNPIASQEVASKLRAPDVLYYVLKCVADDGRILDLIDHEVEPVLGGKDWCGR